MRNFFSATAAFIAIALSMTSCGLFKSDYKPYDYQPAASGDAGTGDGGSGSCSNGEQLASFQANIASAVNNTCSGAFCHAIISKMMLQRDNDDSNRQKLLAYSGGDSAKLIGFLHSSSHSGGDMSANLPAAAIETWLGVEAGCK